MPNYQNSKIYTIRCRTDETLIYIGSTTNYLSKRWQDHKYKVKKGETSKLFTKMREIGIENFYIELYEHFPCDSKEELMKKEGEVIRKISTLNEKIEGRTRKEYFKEVSYPNNKEKHNQKGKEWRDNNVEYCKQYREKRKEHKSKMDKERLQGEKREEILQKKREYHQKNKEVLNKQRAERYRLSKLKKEQEQKEE
jgi:hypothetical protein